MRASGSLADREDWGRRLRSGAASAVLAATRIPKAEMEEPPGGHLPQNAWQSEERGRDAARTSAASPAGLAKDALGSPGDPVRTSTAVAQRQFGPRLGGRKISRMAAGLFDRFLLEQGDFPLVDPPCAGRGIPRSVRVNDSGVVPEGPLDQGQSEPFGVQK